MARPVRFLTTITTSLLSLCVLGGVWGAVVLLLPQNQEMRGIQGPKRLALVTPSETVAGSPSEIVGIESVSPAVLPPPDPLPLPSPSTRVRRSSPSAALNLEIRCESETEHACPEGSFEERRRCMQARFKQLSAPCRQRAKEQLARMKVTLEHMRVACEADARRFCRDVVPGSGGVLQCLEAHAQDVSDSCFQVLPKKGRLLN